MSRSSALSMNAIDFDMHNLNGALFSNTTAFCVISSYQPQDLLSLLQQYMHHYNHTKLILA